MRSTWGRHGDDIGQTQDNMNETNILACAAAVLGGYVAGRTARMPLFKKALLMLSSF